MATKNTTLKIFLGFGLVAGAALTFLAISPRGKNVRQTVRKKVKAGSKTIRKMREPRHRSERTYA